MNCWQHCSVCSTSAGLHVYLTASTMENLCVHEQSSRVGPAEHNNTSVGASALPPGSQSVYRIPTLASRDSSKVAITVRIARKPDIVPSGSNDVPPKMRRYGTPTLYHGLQELFMYLREKFAAKLNDGSLYERRGSYSSVYCVLFAPPTTLSTPSLKQSSGEIWKQGA